MRRITKQGNGGNHLTQAHAHPPQTRVQATSSWRAFGYKADVTALLLEEQYQLCCYSEIRADSLGLGYHIEHVQPKSQYPQRTFDYQNLGASALNSSHDLKTFKAQKLEIFGGHAKRSEYDPLLFVSCHQQDCARFFAYLSDGRVVPASNLNVQDTDKAKYTIDTLNLNSPYLVTQRQRWWNELDQLYEQHQIDNWSLEHLAAVDLVPSGNSLSQFFSLTRQFFGSIAEQVLHQQAPQLI